MKRFAYLFSLTTVAFFLAFTVFTGCEGPAGIAGVDANETCTVCHNDNSGLLAKQVQHSNSGHMTGGNFERSDADCAACHTHEGFMDRMASGEMEASADISDPTPPNCRTCHMVHSAYDSTDWTLTYTDPVELWVNGVTVDVGKGNLCANCHQPRVASPLPVLDGGDVTITSPYWGPHYSVQSAILWGTSGYEIAGSESYPSEGNHTHAKAGCNTCHMATPYGNQAGGHSFHMAYDYHGSDRPNMDACSDCHSTATDFDIGGVQTAVTELHDSLGSVLEGKGFLSGGRIVPATYKADEAGAVLNYLLVKGDHSKGVHNPAYVQALLKNTLSSL